MELQSFIVQRRSKLASRLITDTLVNSKELPVMDDSLSFKGQTIDNWVNSGASNDGKSIGSFLGVLAQIILD